MEKEKKKRVSAVVVCAPMSVSVPAALGASKSCSLRRLST